MINTRLKALRTKMQEDGLDAVIFPSNDPHQSEYVADYWKIRAHFSGFTGSAGTLVVTQTEAALWTDSRYFLQVEQQCSDSDVELHKQSIPHAPEHVDWICEILPEKSTIGIDHRLFSYGMMEFIDSSASKKDITLSDIPTLVEEVWEDRLEQTNTPIVDHPIAYCGESREEKFGRVRTLLEENNADYLLVSGLDEIAWLFNIRSTDVDFTPLVTAYGLIGKDSAILYSKESRFDESLLADLKAAGVQLEAYSSIGRSLTKLSKGKRILTDQNALNYACFAAIKGEIVYQLSTIQTWKSIKNAVEIENAKDGMRKDGIALTRFFIWLENYLKENTITEYELGRRLEAFRKEQDLYTGESFAAIVGYKANGAIIHYTAPEKGSATIKNEGVLLIDSGAQYQNATTDITRTIWLGGIPSDDLKKAYTLVLKGYIALETLRFPKEVVGMQLDSFARMHLWQHGMNYGHGTGHGIGLFSMVHEPGQGFSSNGTTSRGTLAHEENQFTSIEPGFYKEGAFGIRTENIVVSKIVETTDFGTFMEFEPITVCPIDTTLIDHELFTVQEVDWINAYHAKVYATLKNDLNAEEQNWLKEKCNPIVRS